MHRLWSFCGLLSLALFAGVRRIDSQTNAGAAESAASYRLSVSVDEVVLTFHATDANGLPVNDLKEGELSLFDNGRPQHRILAFQSLESLPVRAGILVDTSESMARDLNGSLAAATRYTQRLLWQKTDQGFVMKFGALSEVTQPWTSDVNAFTSGIRRSTGHERSSLHGTVLFDAIYGACLNQFAHIDYGASGNFILLFSDGEDNACHSTLRQAVDMCQHSNTAIYPIRIDSKTNFFSSGPRTLQALASESGGRVFRADSSDAEMDYDLRVIESDLRNQYRVIYRPAELKRDGSFHRIMLLAPERVESVRIRSGYYAPVR